MAPSVFTRIINGEIPSHKIYEDANTFAFLDIHPIQPGHTLVVPKVQVDKLEDLPDVDYRAVMATVKLLMPRLRSVLRVKRACLIVEGFDVPHAHVHIVPCETAADFLNRRPMENEPDYETLAAIADKLRLV